MAKPIFVAYLPNEFTIEEVERCKDLLDQKLDDYHVLVIQSKNKQLRFECYNASDMTPLQLEELKQIFNKSINQ
jgi:hypothetical protein